MANKIQFNRNGAITIIEPVNIELSNEITSGTLETGQLTILRESKVNYIVYGTEIYKLYDNNIDGDLLTYICITKVDSTVKVKSIIIRISTLAWQFSELTDSSAGSGVQASEFNKSSKTTFGDYIISKKVLVYNGGGSISDGATFTFDTAVSHPSVLELVLRNNGRNSNEYIKILSVSPGGGTCSIHSFNSSDEMVIISFRFISDTTMEIAGSIGLTDYDSWQLLKVYKVIE